MRFNPKTKEELDTLNLMKPGIYNFSVVNAEDATSKNGNEMIKLNLEVYDMSTNTNGFIFDYILEAMPTKLYAFCHATGMGHHYSNGTLRAQDCIGKSAALELTVQKGKDNPNGGSYPDKNEVKRYFEKVKADSDTKKFSDKEFDNDI